MNGGFAGWSFGAAVGGLASMELISATNGRQVASGSRRWPGSLRQHRGRRRSVVQLDAHPAFCLNPGELQEPGASFASGRHRELNRVKERSYECMVTSSTQ